MLDKVGQHLISRAVKLTISKQKKILHKWDDPHISFKGYKCAKMWSI